MRRNFMKRTVSTPVGITVGTSLSVISAVGGVAILACLIGTERIAEGTTRTGCMFIHFLSAFLGSLVSAAITKQKRLPVCIITAAAYLGIMLAMTALLFGGQYQGIGSTALIVMAGGGAAVLPAFIRKGSGGRMKKLRSIR